MGATYHGKRAMGYRWCCGTWLDFSAELTKQEVRCFVRT